MPGVPLPFVMALLLAILLVRLIRQREPGERGAMIFIAASLVLVVLVGLRWSIDSLAVRLLQPLIASLLPPIAWFCFAAVRGQGSVRYWPHAIPVLVIAVLTMSAPRWNLPLDLILVSQFFAYGFALVRLGLRGPDGLLRARLTDAATANRATFLAGSALCASAASDVLIAGDFGFYRGAHAATLVAVGNIMITPVIAWAVVAVGEASGSEATAESGDDAPEAEHAIDLQESAADDEAVIAAVDRLMRERRLHRDPDLTLDRLARRAGIPARQISAAINRRFGRNVSQVVNEYRIAEAQQLLKDSTMPVTSVMFESGFQTKSNFNREFLRVTGMKPSEYRRVNMTIPGVTSAAQVGPSIETR